MARIKIIIYDDGEGAVVEFIPDHDFDAGADNLTVAQDIAMRAMQMITDESEVIIADNEHGTIQ
ncbi:hypothetical protein CCP2SC5_1020017 [Azospirillaceae bacterium]